MSQIINNSSTSRSFTKLLHRKLDLVSTISWWAGNLHRVIFDWPWAVFGFGTTYHLSGGRGVGVAFDHQTSSFHLAEDWKEKVSSFLSKVLLLWHQLPLYVWARALGMVLWACRVLDYTLCNIDGMLFWLSSMLKGKDPSSIQWNYFRASSSS